MAAQPKVQPIYFAEAAAFRAWLAEHGASAAEVTVGFHKVATGRAVLRWSESVDEAVCVGWIDGVTRRIDDERFCIRFTPRRPGSIWSKVNIAKVARLRAEGRMTAAGEAAYARRSEAKSGIYAFERPDMPELSAAELREFERRRAAWRFFEATPAGYRKVVLNWVTTAKRPETRAARLAKLIAACAAGERLR